MRHAVILAGGVGERFWPLSRTDRPKQFLPLGGKVSLLRATFERVRAVVPAERVWVVTAASQARRVRRELPEVPRANVLAEPVGRNTAPAVYLAALAARRRDPSAVLVVVPSDAWIPKPAPYRRALRAALAAAERHDALVLVGVHPTRAETGYGYILPGGRLPNSGARSVARFEEKPDTRTAARYYKRGKHLWNCGIFAWKASVLVRAVDRWLPDLARAFRTLEKDGIAPKTLMRAYRRAPAVSVDYGILEHASGVAVVPADFPWDDLGSWRALERLGKNGSFQRGDVVALDSPGGVAWAESGVVALVGVENVIVVHTPDATLVVAKDRAQDVRRIVERLKKTNGTKRYLKV